MPPKRNTNKKPNQQANQERSPKRGKDRDQQRQPQYPELQQIPVDRILITAQQIKVLKRMIANFDQQPYKRQRDHGISERFGPLSRLDQMLVDRPQSGDYRPPVLVKYSGDGYYELLDGYHRVTRAIIKGMQTISAVVQR